MGCNTYSLGCSSYAAVEGSESQIEAAVIALACTLHPNVKDEAGTCSIEEALGELGMDDVMSLSDERPNWYQEKELEGTPYATKGGASVLLLVARAIAPWVQRGSWEMYETEGEAWGLVWDGVTCVETSVRPVPPAGVVLL